MKSKKVTKTKKTKKPLKLRKKVLVKKKIAKKKAVKTSKKKIIIKVKKKKAKKTRPTKRRKAVVLQKTVKRVKKVKKAFKKPKKFRVILKTGRISSHKLRLASGRKVSRNSAVQDFLPETFFKAKIKVIGIGGGGSSIVSEIGRSLHKATFVVADTDVRAFKKKLGIKQFLFGQELTHGLGTGLNTNLAKAAAESEKEKIVKLFEGQDIVIFIACLGGGLGSGATQVFASLAKNFGGISFGIFTLPFKFEGKNKYSIASKALRELRKSLHVSITIPNERIFKVIEANTAITDAFSMVNKNLIESLESLIDLIYSPGVINIDFADLKAILQGTGNLAFLNTVEAFGADRAEKIAQEVLTNPLYQNNNFVVQKVLFNIASSGNLSMFEVDKISRAIAKQHESAKIIFGISRDASLKNRIKTTLLMTGPTTQVLLTKPALQIDADKHADLRKQPAQKKIKETNIKPVVKISKASSKTKKVVPKKKAEKVALQNQPVAVFNNAGATLAENMAKLTVINDIENQKKAIRRTALEIKETEAMEENKRSDQEKEWEIPAFLRKIKINKNL